MTRAEKIAFVRTIAFWGFALAVFCHFILSGLLLRQPYPVNTFLLRHYLFAADFHECVNCVRDLNPYLGGTINWRPHYDIVTVIGSSYFPFANVLIWLFTLVNFNLAYVFYLAMTAGFVCWAGLENLRGRNAAETWLNIIVILLLSYPFLLLLNHGNFEILTFAALYFFLLLYRNGKYGPAGALLGAAVAFKPFPAVFAGLFLLERRFKPLLYSALVFTALTGLSLLAFKGGFLINLRGVFGGIDVLSGFYVAGKEGIAFNHTYFAAIKLLMYLFSGIMPDNLSGKFLSSYFVFASALGLLTLWLVARERLFWKKVFLLVFAMDALPYLSFDFKLIHFFLPLFLFFDAAPSRYDKAYAVVFALLLVPKSYYYFALSQTTSSVLLNPLVMTAGAALITWEQFNRERIAA